MDSRITFGNRVKVKNSVRGFVDKNMGEERRNALNSTITAFESSKGDTFVKFSTPKKDKSVITLEVTNGGMKVKRNMQKHFFMLASPKAISSTIKSYFSLN